jgi:tRNA (guanine37-N1)-methyltransferase
MASFLRRLIASFKRPISDVEPRKMNFNSPDLPEVFRPPVNRSMQTLDRSVFRKSVVLAAATVSDVKQITTVRNNLSRSGDLLKISPIKPLRDDDSAPGSKCLLLRPGIKANGELTLLYIENYG